jgi:cysteinyl-tRNA synthetase
VRDLLQSHRADAVRVLVNSHPYYETWEYDAAELEPADELAARLLRAATAQGGAGPKLEVDSTVSAFEAALDDNLNTRAALEALGNLAEEILFAAARGRSVSEAQRTLRRLGTVFGLRLDGDVEPRVVQGWAVHYQRFQ